MKKKKKVHFFPGTLLLYAFHLLEYFTSQNASKIPGPRPLSPDLEFPVLPHGLRCNSFPDPRQSL